MRRQKILKWVILIMFNVVGFCIIFAMKLTSWTIYATPTATAATTTPSTSPKEAKIQHLMSNDTEEEDNAANSVIDLGVWDASKNYKYFPHILTGRNFAKASKEHSVTLASQSSLDHLYHIPSMLSRWNGPASVAVFVVSHEYQVVMSYFHWLFNCFDKDFQRLSVHLLFDRSHFPEFSHENGFLNKNSDCQKEPKDKLIDGRNEKAQREDMLYPQSHVRNLARKASQTKHVLLVDVDMEVGPFNLSSMLDIFLREQEGKCEKCAFVIPTYEIEASARVPWTKQELLQLVARKLARSYRVEAWPPNQRATNHKRYESYEDVGDGRLSICYSVPADFEFFYEPFYVSWDAAPAHDERFVGYGFTRNTQVYEMQQLGWLFHVISPAFAIHRGMAKSKSRGFNRAKQNAKNAAKFDQFKLEVAAKARKIKQQ